LHFGAAFVTRLITHIAQQHLKSELYQIRNGCFKVKL